MYTYIYIFTYTYIREETR